MDLLSVENVAHWNMNSCWKTYFTRDTREWLLNGEPWVIYHTLVDLSRAQESDKNVSVAQNNVLRHNLIRRILSRRNASGYWGSPGDIHTWWPKKDTTFWILGMLGDFGLKVEDENLWGAATYVFSIQQENGAFIGFDPKLPYDCHTAILTESLVKIGLLKDQRVQKAYDWLLKRQRCDGGWWCKNTGQIGHPREKEPSCAMATMFVLGAMAENPKAHEDERVRKGVDFLFECWEKRGKMRYAGHDSQIGTDWDKLKYPFTDYKILKFLDVLSKFDFARDRLRDSEMVKLLLSKRDADGRFKPQSIHNVWSDFDFGQKDESSRWITLLALRIMKRVCDSDSIS